jgi:hypothetical protein
MEQKKERNNERRKTKGARRKEEVEEDRSLENRLTHLNVISFSLQ